MFSIVIFLSNEGIDKYYGTNLIGTLLSTPLPKHKDSPSIGISYRLQKQLYCFVSWATKALHFCDRSILPHEVCRVQSIEDHTRTPR